MQTYILTIDAEHQPESPEITGALMDLLREKRGDSREIIGVGSQRPSRSARDHKAGGVMYLKAVRAYFAGAVEEQRLQALCQLHHR
jgi:hypothetical protein